MDVIVHPAGNIECFTARIECDAIICIWHLHGLLLNGQVLGNVVNENVFVGSGTDPFPGSSVIPVVTGRQNQQSLLVRTHDTGYGSSGSKTWEIGKVRVQWFEPGSAGRERRQQLTGIRNNLGILG